MSDSGAAQAVLDPGRQPPVGEAEIKNFLTLFERFFWGLNFYGYEQDLKLAFSMMTQNFQRKADELLKREGTVESLQANQSKVTVTLTELEVLRDTPELLECRVLGNRQIASYNRRDLRARSSSSTTSSFGRSRARSSRLTACSSRT